MATTFSLVVIFIPVSFMSSISGRFPLPVRHHRGRGGPRLLLVSFTLTPMMSARLLGAMRGKTGRPALPGGFYRWIDAGYERLLALALQHGGRGAGLGGRHAVDHPPVRADPPGLPPGQRGSREFNVNVTAPQVRAWPAWTA